MAAEAVRTGGIAGKEQASRHHHDEWSWKMSMHGCCLARPGEVFGIPDGRLLLPRAGASSG
jgi:hypothetical protein